MTINDFATKFNVSKTIAYGFLRFMEGQGVVTKTGRTKPEGGRGKGSANYELTATANSTVSNLLSQLK